MARQLGATAPTDEYRLLLSPAFAAMSKITENIFLTGVGGMTRENFARNHIDFVVNITTDAPFWPQIDSIRIAVEDDSSSNLFAIFDQVIDRMHEQIVRRNAHVLVHCVAGVSRSATLVIGYLMKVRRMSLKQAFNHCYGLRPVIRPNNGFMVQLINYEQQLFGRMSVRMVEVDVDGTLVWVPNFFVDEHPHLVMLEVLRARDEIKKQQQQQQQLQQHHQTTNQQTALIHQLQAQPAAAAVGAMQHEVQQEASPAAQHSLNLPHAQVPMPSLHPVAHYEAQQQQQQPQQQQQQQQQPLQAPSSPLPTSPLPPGATRQKSHKHPLGNYPHHPMQTQHSNSAKQVPRGAAASRHGAHHARPNHHYSTMTITRSSAASRSSSSQSSSLASAPSSPALGRVAGLSPGGGAGGGATGGKTASVMSSAVSRLSQAPSVGLDQAPSSASPAISQSPATSGLSVQATAKQLEFLARTKRSPATPRSE